MELKQLIKNKFVQKSILLVAIIFLIQGAVRFTFHYYPILLNLFKHPTTYSFFDKVDLVKSLIFILIVFILYNREILSRIKDYKNKLISKLIFATLSIISLLSYYYIRYFINKNLEFALNNLIIFSIIKAVLLIFYLLFLILAIFNIKTIKEFFKVFKKQIPIFSIIFVFYYLAVHYSLKLWPFFSKIVAIVTEKFFSLFYTTKLSFASTGPKLTIEDFKVIIGAPCSGIDSMLLFLTLFFLIFFLDYRRLNKKNMLLLFIPGLLGIFLFNIARIFILLLVGLYISKDFAVGLFHQNIGWLLFIIYFIFFYLITKRLIYKKVN